METKNTPDNSAVKAPPVPSGWARPDKPTRPPILAFPRRAEPFIARVRILSDPYLYISTFSGRDGKDVTASMAAFVVAHREVINGEPRTTIKTCTFGMVVYNLLFELAESYGNPREYDVEICRVHEPGNEWRVAGPIGKRGPIGKATAALLAEAKIDLRELYGDNKRPFGTGPAIDNEFDPFAEE